MAARGGIYFQHALSFSYVRHSPARMAISRQEQALRKFLTNAGDGIFSRNFSYPLKMVILENHTQLQNFMGTFWNLPRKNM